MRSTSSSLLVCCLAACAVAPPPDHPRPILPPHAPATVAPVPTPTLTRLEQVGPARYEGTLRCDDEEVVFRLWRAPTGDRPRPFVLLVPILAGGDFLMELVADGMIARGFDCALCARAGSALSQGQRGPELEALFQRTVLHQRLFLSWLRNATVFSPQPHFVLGISLGGMVATAVAAQEPALTGVAICLSGADLTTIVPASAEPRVQRWVRWRHEADGIGLDALRAELHTHLHSDPLLQARAIPTAKVFMVTTTYDDVVPPANQDLLWEALGRPARMTVPLGHYSAALAIAPILTATCEHFRSLLSRVPTRPR